MNVMSRSRSQKATFNLASSAAYEVVALVSTMILPRLILSYYGSAYNGIATSASQFLSLISVLTLGVTASTRMALYKTLSRNDIAGTSAIVRATEQYMRRVGMVLLAYVVGLAIVYPLVVKTDYSYLDVAILIVITGANSFAEYYFGTTYWTLLLADQSVYISNIFRTLSTILSLAVTIFLIRLGCSYQVVKLGAAVVHLTRLVFQTIYVRKHYRLDRHCAPDKSALKTRSDAMAHALANIIHDHTDAVVLTLFTDVKTVSVYTIYNLVMNALKKILSIFNTGTEPVIGSMWAKNEKEKIRKTLDFYEFSMALFTSSVFGTTLVMLLPFVSIYTREITDVQYIRPDYGLVITLAFAVQCFRGPYLCVVQGAGHYKQTKSAAFWEAGINIGLSVLLVNLIGMTGVAVGTLAANLYRTLQYAVYIDKHIIHRGKGVFIKKMLWAFFNIAVITVPAYPIVQRYSFDGWWSWLALAAGVFVLSTCYSVLSALLFFRKDFFSACKILLGIAKKTLHRG